MGQPEEPKIYDLDQVTCNFLGLSIESGFGDGSAIKIEKPDATFMTKVGADGSIVRSKKKSFLYKVTISLLQTAAGNEVLSKIHQVDVAKPNGAGVGPLIIRDRQGTSEFFASKAWIVTFPSVEYGAEATNRDWELAAVATYHNVGSN